MKSTDFYAVDSDFEFRPGNLWISLKSAYFPVERETSQFQRKFADFTEIHIYPSGINREI